MTNETSDEPTFDSMAEKIKAVEANRALGMSIKEACKAAGLSSMTYYKNRPGTTPKGKRGPKPGTKHAKKTPSLQQLQLFNEAPAPTIDHSPHKSSGKIACLIGDTVEIAKALKGILG